MTAGDRLVFRAGDRRYAVAAGRVRELARLPRLTPVPLAPPGLLGLGNVRGETIAVLSPAAMTGGEALGAARHLLVLGGSDPIALAIDAVERSDGDEAGRIEDFPLDQWIAQAFPLRASARRATAGGAMARPVRHAMRDDRLALLRVAIGDQSFALPLEEVAQVLRMPRDVALLPGADAAVVGTIRWRDRSLGVLSLAALLGLAGDEGAETDRARRRIVVVTLGGQDLGLLVDHVEGLLRVSPGRIDSLPTALLRTEGEARISAICRPEGGGRLVSILAVDELLRDPAARLPVTKDQRTGKAAPASSPSSQRMSLLLVRIGPHDLALPVGAIDKVMGPPERLTTLPGAPPWLAGLAAAGGEPLAAVDQVMRLTGSPASGARRRLIVLRTDGRRVGFLVDEARTVLAVERSMLVPAPLPDALADGIFGEVLHASDGGGRTLLVVQPAALLSSAEQALMAEIARRQPTPAP
ncbi:chemotaxis protein CheW [Sphingobium sp. PNB]|uniref:chemotaxis protein CheW n=1 Tax=Sphingobium sp. PNB TaxID=863934 RepID=UPI001CA3D793|nr:chemotaxis protein CheW [Sphingobium sp. PNB]MCB4858031.1 chemotaxis protein CheW [Sphingobium sp. PNB]